MTTFFVHAWLHVCVCVCILLPDLILEVYGFSNILDGIDVYTPKNKTKLHQYLETRACEGFETKDWRMFVSGIQMGWILFSRSFQNTLSKILFSCSTCSMIWFPFMLPWEPIWCKKLWIRLRASARQSRYLIGKQKVSLVR